MEKYVAFLRGINISGKNKIPMKELKQNFMKLGFYDVESYLNSGNVMFSSDISDNIEITSKIISMIKDEFGLSIPVLIITLIELKNIVKSAPFWWDNEDKSIYNNLIFIIPPTTFVDVYKEIGEPKDEYEKIYNYKNAIFWSFVKKDYSKTKWIKTASSNINDKITIRTANTVKNILKRF